MPIQREGGYKGSKREQAPKTPYWENEWPVTPYVDFNLSYDNIYSSSMKALSGREIGEGDA